MPADSPASYLLLWSFHPERLFRLIQGTQMNKLVVGNILYRPVRSAISGLAVAIEVIMILSIVAIMIAQVQGASSPPGGVGAHIIVRPPNASFLSAVGGAPVPAKVAQVLAKLPHVAVAAPVIAN